MNKFLLIPFTSFFVSSAFAENPVVITEKDTQQIPELQVNVAKTQAKQATVAELPTAKPIDIQASKQELLQNQPLTELLLNRAIESGQMGAVVDLLAIYQTFPPARLAFSPIRTG